MLVHASDLEMYAKTIGIFSSTVWKYVWLLIVISLTALNFKWILQKKTLKSNQPPK